MTRDAEYCRWLLSDVSPEVAPASLRKNYVADILTVITGSADKELIWKQFQFFENLHSQSAADSCVVAARGASQARVDSRGYRCDAFG